MQFVFRLLKKKIYIHIIRYTFNNVFHISRRHVKSRHINITNEIPHTLKQKLTRMMHEERSIQCYERISYFRQNLILYNSNTHGATYIHMRTYNCTPRRTARGPFFRPNLFLLPIRDRVTWFWNLSKEPASWFLERRLKRKVYAKYPLNFPRFFSTFSCFVLLSK